MAKNAPCPTAANEQACPTAEPPAAQAVADQIANTLLSGLAGMALYRALSASFPTANRDDYAFGTAMAFSIYEADRIGLVHDLHVAERKLAGLQAGSEAA